MLYSANDEGISFTAREVFLMGPRDGDAIPALVSTSNSGTDGRSQPILELGNERSRVAVFGHIL